MRGEMPRKCLDLSIAKDGRSGVPEDAAADSRTLRVLESTQIGFHSPEKLTMYPESRPYMRDILLYEMLFRSGPGKN